MQKIRIDFDNPGLPQHISAVENDSQSRFFQATLYENGKAYTAPEGAAYSIMYRGFGPQNQGWYDTINDGAGKRAACVVSGNVVTCEIARQALQVPGHVSIVLCVTTGKGYMIKSWPIECDCKNDRYDSTVEIQSFFYITQVSNADWNQIIQALEELKNTIDPTLSLSGKAADAAKVGEAINAETTRAKTAEEENANGVSQLKEDLGKKINKPITTDNNKFPRAKNGDIEWVEQGLPTDEQTASAVANWLNEHPEATTTVVDGSITEAKLNNAFLNMIGYPIYDTFPTESIINALGNNAIFYTRGFYKKNDGGDCCYIIHKSKWMNCININNTYCVSPLGMAENTILVNKYGILPNRTGAENTEAFSKLKMRFGTTIQFAEGHYHFDSPIDFSDLQCSIIGSHSMYLNDVNVADGTWLHFENLSDGDSAIKIRAGIIENICVIGSKDQYSLKIDRNKVMDDPEHIATETYTVKCCGIELISRSKIKGTAVRNFYNGITGSAGNQSISGVVVNNCHSGIICKNDNKVFNATISNVMIGIESRGSVNSLISIRGDSIGMHLILVAGTTTTIIDADGDFCCGALLSVGDNNDNLQEVAELCVVALHGRSNAKRSYNKDSNPPTLENITNDNLWEFPKIAVQKNTNLLNANIQMNSLSTGYILDDRTDYLFPDLLLACGTNGVVQNVKIVIGYGNNNLGRIDKEFCKKRIKSLSQNANNLSVSVENCIDRMLILKSGTIYTYSSIQYTKID